MSKLDRLKNSIAAALTALREISTAIDNLPDDLTEDEKIEAEVRLTRFIKETETVFVDDAQ